MSKVILEKIKKELKQVSWLRQSISWIRHIREYRLLVNVNHVSGQTNARRALLVYLTSAFLMNRNSARFVAHQNRWACIEIARLLGELGYVVDVINWDDYETNVSPDYDLLIGLGRAEALAEIFPPKTLKIYLATGSQANFFYQRVNERLAEIKQKRGCELGAVRSNLDRADRLKYFDTIACIGNEVTAATYRPYFQGPIHLWNNHGYDKWLGIPSGKNFEESRRHFLYFSSGGQVLVGLDLVLETFVSRPHLKLFVCGPFEQERDFVKCFHKELYETPNIVPIGWVVAGSDQYFDLVRKCGATIFPICAGGSPGSVTMVMGQGIIPIVSKEAGMDVDDFGIILPSITAQDIGSAVDWLASQSSEWHRDMSFHVLEAARQNFSQGAFTRRFREILVTAIENKTGYRCQP